MVTVAQLNGPMWAVAGQSIEVPAGVDPARAIIDHLDADSGDLDTREVEVRPIGQAPFTVTLGTDGSVTTATLTDPRILGWLRPARTGDAPAAADVPVAVTSGWAVYGAHPGAGASTWADLLDGTDITGQGDYPGRVLVVARTTLGGVEAAKTLTHRAGAVLMVADAPGRVTADVRRGLRVLAGAAPVVRTPWLSPLRGTLTVSRTRAVSKAAAKIAAAIRGNWKEPS